MKDRLKRLSEWWAFWRWANVQSLDLPPIVDWFCIIVGLTWQGLAIYGLIRLFV